MYILRNSYLPKVISWIDKKNRSLYVFYNLLREETLPLQFVTVNGGCVRDMIEQKYDNPISNLATDNI